MVHPPMYLEAGYQQRFRVNVNSENARLGPHLYARTCAATPHPQPAAHATDLFAGL